MVKSKNPKILVTGALGHIGSALIRQLPAVAKQVVMLDNLESQRYCSLFNLPPKGLYHFIEADIREADFNSILNPGDIVVHLAALTNAESSATRQKEVESVNLEGLKRVADACLANKVKLFFPSTTSVYGSQETRVDETCPDLKPQSPYAESKLAAEKYLQQLGGQGLDFIICRFGTIFGPSIGMRFHTAVNKFIWQAVLGQPLSVWQTAWKQKRPYLDLKDAVAAVNFIIEKNLFDGRIYNVVTDNFTVKDIVETIKEFIPQLTVNYVDSPIMNQLSYEIDAGKFKQQGFTFKGDLRPGVGDTVQQFKRIKPLL